MGRLIDADALIEEIKNASQRYCDCKDCDGKGQIIRVSEVIDIVKNEVPTAYDVENVVKKLIIIKRDYVSEYDYDKANVMKKAIEIVRKGDVE